MAIRNQFFILTTLDNLDLH